jgi:putative hydrolase of the HAD superfamily
MINPTTLYALLFDLDNTLIDRDQAAQDCVHAHFTDPRICSELIRLDGGGRGDRTTFFACWERHAGTAMNQDIFGSLLRKHIHPDPGLIAALQALSIRFKLGIITNGSSESQHRKYLSADLAKVIPREHFWISGEVGLEKPHPGIFQLASQSLGLTPDQCLYIGDHEQDDRIGASNAGMRACRADTVLDAERLEDLLRREL